MTDLRKVFPGGVVALDGVSFTVERGEIFGYLGRNGAGKTTTVRILCGLTAATSGEAWVDGLEVEWHPRRLKAVIGVALQGGALDDLMTGREHLELGARLGRLPRAEWSARAGELLEMFGLEGAGERLVASYSGGMRRRLEVAMALVHRPRVLFLDEPTTGLDPQGRRSVRALIRELRGEGATVFLTTQNIDEADALCDRVGIVHQGSMAALGTPSELKSSLPDRTERLVVEGPSLEDVFVALTGERPDAMTESERAGAVEAARRALGGRRE